MSAAIPWRSSRVTKDSFLDFDRRSHGKLRFVRSSVDRMANRAAGQGVEAVAMSVNDSHVSDESQILKKTFAYIYAPQIRSRHGQSHGILSERPGWLFT